MDLSLPHLLNELLATVSAGMKNWGGLHPLIVHFPIALLFVSPAFLALGLLFPKSARTWFLSSLILMGLGTLSILLAVSSGEAASETLKLFDNALETLEEHNNLGEKSRLIFIALTTIFAFYFFAAQSWLKSFSQKIHLAFLVLFLLCYTYALLILCATAHEGGTLVHRHGIKSQIFSQ